MLIDVLAWLTSFVVTVVIFAGFVHRVVENERAVEQMIRSAKEAEAAGEIELARRRFDAACKISERVSL